jgi:hypothetical protein
MPADRVYVGIEEDQHGGLTDTGRIIMDAWVFGLLPESETCRGWPVAEIQLLYDKVSVEWARYGYRVANLPPEVRERHARIYDAAVERARSKGWTPELSVMADSDR